MLKSVQVTLGAKSILNFRRLSMKLLSVHSCVRVTAAVTVVSPETSDEVEGLFSRLFSVETCSEASP